VIGARIGTGPCPSCMEEHGALGASPQIPPMRVLLFALGILLLLVPEFLRVFYIMPFPGSQENMPTGLHQVDVAYWLHRNIRWFRLAGLLALAGPFIHYWRNGKRGARIAVAALVVFCALFVGAFNLVFMADKMFYPPKTKAFAPPVITDSTARSLVIAVEMNGDARAYPIELIGYHHQVHDTIGGLPVLITYCTVCRTGRAWEPVVNGRLETFRLVGMDHFNAMFEDRTTGSWWRQVSGECIEGSMRGQRLPEVESHQLTLKAFAERYPNGIVLRPDSAFTEHYAGLRGFDDGTIDSGLERRDPASWGPKSWVVGIERNGSARAYDWNDLQRLDTLRDTLDRTPVLLVAQGASGFAAYSEATDTVFVEDPLTGARMAVASMQLKPEPAYQEFWHSWRTFHPNTTQYTARK